MQRRRFLIQSGTALASTALVSGAPSVAGLRFRFGTCRLNLIDAKAAGLEGIEFRTELIEGKLNVANPDVIREQRGLIAQTGLPPQACGPEGEGRRGGAGAGEFSQRRGKRPHPRPRRP